MSVSRRPQVIVVGVGSIGSMVLWQLASRGIDVLGIEQFGRVHPNGAYAGESRLFRVAAKEGELFTPALLRSRELWRELGAAYGSELLLPVGALSVAPADHPDLVRTLGAIRHFDLPHEVLDTGELRKRFPQFAVDDVDIGVLDLLGGAMRPEVAVAAATEQALANGASLLTDTTVSEIEETVSGVKVVTSRGEFTSDRVVITAGPWVAEVLPELSDLVVPKTFALTWVMPRHIEMFTADRLPGFMRDRGDVHAFGVPTLDGYSIKICPHLEFDETLPPPTRLTREQLCWVGEQAEWLCPDLIGEVVRWSLHRDSWTSARMPIIDHVGESVIVATALSGNGFKFAPVWGEMLADMAVGSTGQFAAEPFGVAAHRTMRLAQP